ncbi:putative adhesin [Streptomyces sp. NPDC091376]|uniref:putative adhesin n=1 Tax=Streptomyces sp. NPDC091376 TaxID=3365994 RepID=UPI003810513D
MTTHIVCSGHGSFSKKSGFDKIVPEGSLLHIYTSFGKTTADSNGRLIESFDEVLASVDRREIHPGRKYPNLKLTTPLKLAIHRLPPDGIKGDNGNLYLQIIPGENGVPDEIFLDWVFQKFPDSIIHWAACVAVELKNTGGRWVGVNNVQPNLGHSLDESTTPQYSTAIPHADEDGIARLHEVKAVNRAAFPHYGNIAAYAGTLMQFAHCSNAEEVASTYYGLPESERRGMLMNEASKGWLHSYGIHTMDPPIAESASPSLDARDIDWSAIRWMSASSISSMFDGELNTRLYGYLIPEFLPGGGHSVIHTSIDENGGLVDVCEDEIEAVHEMLRVNIAEKSSLFWIDFDGERMVVDGSYDSLSLGQLIATGLNDALGAPSSITRHTIAYSVESEESASGYGSDDEEDEFHGQRRFRFTVDFV